MRNVRRFNDVYNGNIKYFKHTILYFVSAKHDENLQPF